MPSRYAMIVRIVDDIKDTVPGSSQEDELLKEFRLVRDMDDLDYMMFENTINLKLAML